MPSKHSRHIALTGPLGQYVDEQVARGEYTSASELVRTAIRLLMERDAAAARRRPPPADTPSAADERA